MVLCSDLGVSSNENTDSVGSNFNLVLKVSYQSSEKWLLLEYFISNDWASSMALKDDEIAEAALQNNKYIQYSTKLPWKPVFQNWQKA